MFLSPKNRDIIRQSIFENKVPDHLKDQNLINKYMDVFANQSDASKSIIETNKDFLLFYIKNIQPQLQEIKMNDFDNELKKHQQNFEEVITLKKPLPINFEENVTSALDETAMEKELRIKMEERQYEMETILSKQKPIVIENETTSVRELKNEKPVIASNYEAKSEVKRVSFKEEPETNKLDIVIFELNLIKQELVEIKKMILLTQSQ
jgi:hypothetical protein